MICKVLLFGLAYLVLSAVMLRRKYLDAMLAPYGSGSMLKDLAAYSMASLPRLGRVLKTGSLKVDVSKQASEMEGFHTGEYDLMKENMLNSVFFAENYYFWISDPSSTDFLVTTRLSFHGVNASMVMPWFTFQINGEEWNLPSDFEPEPHDHFKDPRLARDPRYGELLYENPEPLKLWKITYQGVVENAAKTSRVKVSCVFQLSFSTDNVFLYQVHVDDMTTGLSLAGKPWTSSFFQHLRSQNQVRYASRALTTQGEVSFLESETKHTFESLQGSRDHLWGIRNWLFIYRYIWWPPITLKDPLVIEGIQYKSFIGAFVEYGDTMDNMVAGGFMSDQGDCASFSGATHIRNIGGEQWYESKTKRGQIASKFLPQSIRFDLSILKARYIVRVRVDRSYWTHSFLLAEGDFEVQEGLGLYSFQVMRAGSEQVLAESTASGLLEFGCNLVGVNHEE